MSLCLVFLTENRGGIEKKWGEKLFFFVILKFFNKFSHQSDWWQEFSIGRLKFGQKACSLFWNGRTKFYDTISTIGVRGERVLIDLRNNYLQCKGGERVIFTISSPPPPKISFFRGLKGHQFLKYGKKI